MAFDIAALHLHHSAIHHSAIVLWNSEPKSVASDAPVFETLQNPESLARSRRKAEVAVS